MSFVSFLKKAGQILANVAAAEAGIEPIFKAALPASAGATVDKLDLIFKSIVATEGQFAAAFPGQQTGQQKLVAASTLVGPILQTVDTITGRPIANEAAYTTAVQGIVSNIANLMNALQPTNATTQTAAALAAPGTAIASK